MKEDPMRSEKRWLIFIILSGGLAVLQWLMWR
jgi:hypothetical protein